MPRVKLTNFFKGKSLAVEWAAFARVNTVSPDILTAALQENAVLKSKLLWEKRRPCGMYTHFSGSKNHVSDFLQC